MHTKVFFWSERSTRKLVLRWRHWCKYFQVFIQFYSYFLQLKSKVLFLTLASFSFAFHVYFLKTLYLWKVGSVYFSEMLSFPLDSTPCFFYHAFGIFSLWWISWVLQFEDHFLGMRSFVLGYSIFCISFLFCFDHCSYHL